LRRRQRHLEIYNLLLLGWRRSRSIALGVIDRGIHRLVR
jgi:hypothetical protein